MSEDNRVKDMLEGAVKSIRTACDANSVVGETISAPDGTLIVPISRVSFGFGGGGGDFEAKNAQGSGSFAGGIGGGASVRAEAFLVINGGSVRLITMNGGSSPVDRIVDMLPEAIDTVNGFIAKKKDKKRNKTDGDTANDSSEG